MGHLNNPELQPGDLDPPDDEIADGMLTWQPRTLSTKTLERIARDALADLWEDCYRGNGASPSASLTEQRNLFREKVNELIQSATPDDANFLVVKAWS